METDKHYFVEGLFIIVFSIAAAVFAVWLGNPGRRDDVAYRIHFSESVNGLTVGDPVKYHGVDIGTVKGMIIDPDNSRLVQVDVKLRHDAPVKTDTRASLAMKGITGVINIELSSGDPTAKALIAVTPPDKVPEILTERVGLKAALDDLPKVVAKFSAIEDQVKGVVSNAAAVTEKIKANPSVLLKGPEKAKQ